MNKVIILPSTCFVGEDFSLACKYADLHVNFPLEYKQEEFTLRLGWGVKEEIIQGLWPPSNIMTFRFYYNDVTLYNMLPSYFKPYAILIAPEFQPGLNCLF